LYELPNFLLHRIIYFDLQAAQVGDQVVFHFLAKNHTVTQSSFADPCGKKDGGINSGLSAYSPFFSRLHPDPSRSQPVPANTTDNFPTFTIEVKDVGTHCTFFLT
jgi:hypothetical protein